MVDVYKLMSPGVSEETRSGVHDVARLHIRSTHTCYRKPRLNTNNTLIHHKMASLHTFNAQSGCENSTIEIGSPQESLPSVRSYG